MESIQIYLNSQNADKYFNGAADCEYLLPLIEIPDGFHIYLSVVSCLIPYSFYNINSSNNVLKYSFDGVSLFTLTIPIGNYNVNNLLSVLKTNISPQFTITYDNVKNKFTFTHATNDFMFMSSSTCLQILGFNNNETIASNPSASLSLTSVNCVNVYSIRTIQVNSNLITYNINKVQKNNFCILCSVPITCTPFSLIEYINRTNFKTNLFLNRISNIKIKLTDDNGNLIDLNGCHYSLTIQLDVISFT
jgi:hypothetical protein